MSSDDGRTWRKKLLRLHSDCWLRSASPGDVSNPGDVSSPGLRGSRWLQETRVHEYTPCQFRTGLKQDVRELVDECAQIELLTFSQEAESECGIDLRHFKRKRADPAHTHAHAVRKGDTHDPAIQLCGLGHKYLLHHPDAHTLDR